MTLLIAVAQDIVFCLQYTSTNAGLKWLKHKIKKKKRILTFRIYTNLGICMKICI